MPRCMIRELIPTAIEHGEASASDGRWTARKASAYEIGTKIGGVVIRHHHTDMIVYNWLTQQVEGINPGWNSSTDRQGINQILNYVGSSEQYKTLFPDRCAKLNCTSVRLPDSTRCREHSRKTVTHEPEPEPVARWYPPIRVEDTIV